MIVESTQSTPFTIGKCTGGIPLSRAASVGRQPRQIWILGAIAAAVFSCVLRVTASISADIRRMALSVSLKPHSAFLLIAALVFAVAFSIGFAVALAPLAAVFFALCGVRFVVSALCLSDLFFITRAPLSIILSFFVGHVTPLIRASPDVWIWGARHQVPCYRTGSNSVLALSHYSTKALLPQQKDETFPGVRRAVTEFCAARGWPVTFVLPCNGMAVIEVPK